MQPESPSEVAIETAELTASRSDFKVATVLLLIAVALLLHTLSFPMSGSYAGVENQWYVSPALFPLIICSLLALCSLLLLIRAIRHRGASGLLLLAGWVGDWQEKRVRDRWYVIYTLLIFVFILVPSIDFYLASVIFLSCLTCRFYYETKNALFTISLLQLALAITLLVIKLKVNATEDTAWLTVNQDQSVITFSDLTATIAIVCLFLISNLFAENRDLKQSLIQAAVVLLVPLVLVIIFTFLLYVPAPVEYGSVSNFLYYVVYDLLAVQ